MKGGKISITTANGVVVRWGAGLDGYCCDRLYLCSCITADAGSQSHFIHVGKSHPFPEAVAAVTCQSHCANSARQLWWIEGQHCLGRWSIKNKPKNVKVVLKSLGMKKKKKKSLEEVAATSEITDLFGGHSGLAITIRQESDDVGHIGQHVLYVPEGTPERTLTPRLSISTTLNQPPP